MKVECEIPGYDEFDDDSFEPSETNHLVVRSHHEASSHVVLNFGEQSITVSASDLRAAITNATHWHE